MKIHVVSMLATGANKHTHNKQTSSHNGLEKFGNVHVNYTTYSFVPNAQQMFSYIVYMMPKQKNSWFGKTLPDTTSLKKNSKCSYRACDYMMSSMFFTIHMILDCLQK